MADELNHPIRSGRGIPRISGRFCVPAGRPVRRPGPHAVGRGAPSSEPIRSLCVLLPWMAGLGTGKRPFLCHRGGWSGAVAPRLPLHLDRQGPRADSARITPGPRVPVDLSCAEVRRRDTLAVPARGLAVPATRAGGSPRPLFGPAPVSGPRVRRVRGPLFLGAILPLLIAGESAKRAFRPFRADLQDAFMCLCHRFIIWTVSIMSRTFMSFN